MNFNIQAALMVAIVAGIIVSIGAWALYFWLKRVERKKNERINEKLTIF